jgi:hypothetical protein
MIAAALRSLVALGVLWHAVRPGVWQRDATMAETGPLSAVRAVAFRVDPSAHRFALDSATRDYRLRGAWTIDSMPDDAVLAFNAGQFSGGLPWGWVVHNGVESQPPGKGTLGMAFVVDSGGRATLVMPAGLPAVRDRAVVAFQSYPALLVDGKLPWELQGAGRGVNLEHRDSRLALCTLGDGSLVVAITRFNGLGGAASTLPWGPTVLEMAGYLRSLGCRHAMLLDGGMSSQLAARNADGSLMRFPNWRPVPLALVITPRGGPLGAGLLSARRRHP